MTDLLTPLRWPSIANGELLTSMSNVSGEITNAPKRSRGAFDSAASEHLPRTSYDVTIDQTSNKPGEQAFEKMIAGLYLGEIFRLVMCEMIDEGILFLGQETYKVEKPYVFDTAFLSLIESYAVVVVSRWPKVLTLLV